MLPVPVSWGSSPLTRGKPDLSEVGGSLGRLIPAHAGKTLVREATPEDRWAHPRSRGENQPSQTPGRPLLGSSPLTRGKLACLSAFMGKHGLIPAHAGKTP